MHFGVCQLRKDYLEHCSFLGLQGANLFFICSHQNLDHCKLKMELLASPF